MEIYNNHSTSTCLNTFSIYYVLQVFKVKIWFWHLYGLNVNKIWSKTLNSMDSQLPYKFTQFTKVWFRNGMIAKDNSFHLHKSLIYDFFTTTLLVHFSPLVFQFLEFSICLVLWEINKNWLQFQCSFFSYQNKFWYISAHGF